MDSKPLGPVHLASFCGSAGHQHAARELWCGTVKAPGEFRDLSAVSGHSKSQDHTAPPHPSMAPGQPPETQAGPETREAVGKQEGTAHSVLGAFS